MIDKIEKQHLKNANQARALNSCEKLSSSGSLAVHLCLGVVGVNFLRFSLPRGAVACYGGPSVASCMRSYEGQQSSKGAAENSFADKLRVDNVYSLEVSNKIAASEKMADRKIGRLRECRRYKFAERKTCEWNWQLPKIS